MLPTTVLAGLLLKQGKNLRQEGIIVHYRSSTCASATSACGSQNIMSMARYISMAVDSSARACCRWPVWHTACPGRGGSGPRVGACRVRRPG